MRLSRLVDKLKFAKNNLLLLNIFARAYTRHRDCAVFGRFLGLLRGPGYNGPWPVPGFPAGQRAAQDYCAQNNFPL